jgi:hypothetical protein
MDIRNFTSIDFASNRAGDLRKNLSNIIANGKEWPQRLGSVNPGFLSPLLISPSAFRPNGSTSSNTSKKIGSYEYTDWTGQKITLDGTVLLTEDRFNESKGDFPRNDLSKNPYSTRDSYLIFNDNSTDYFRHGLQVIDNINNVSSDNTNTSARLGEFKNTPFENNDPVMFGFEIVIDSVSSPLLNGSITDFLRNYSNISEVASKIPVYEDFKQQFVKFFKTNSTVIIDTDVATISKSSTNYSHSDSPKNLHQSGKTSYMNYYLKKVAGLKNLSESNTGDTKKYLVDYRKDLITLDFNEDVTLSIGTLAHLYKLLYWSKPNGKSIIPENLLRFNCDIIISECRNFNRARKAAGTGEVVEVLKDNLSRYIYSLKECQLFFNMPHPDDVDLSSISTYENFSVSFDYKYSTVNFEKFLPKGNFGQYVGYDSGAIWRIGNPGNRNGRENGQSETSIPKFFTEFDNSLRENGVLSPFITGSYKPDGISETAETLSSITDKYSLDEKTRKELEESEIGSTPKSQLDIMKDNFKLNLKKSYKKLKSETIKSVEKEIVTLVNNRINLLSRTINKIGIGFVGGKGISPPQNVYKNSDGSFRSAVANTKDRFFYDIRNELTDFAGGSLSSFLSGALFKK